MFQGWRETFAKFLRRVRFSFGPLWDNYRWFETCVEFDNYFDEDANTNIHSVDDIWLEDKYKNKFLTKWKDTFVNIAIKNVKMQIH